MNRFTAFPATSLVVFSILFAAHHAKAQVVVDPHDRASVSNLYNNVYLPARTTSNPAWTGSVASCNPGTISGQFVSDTLLTINTYRAMAGLPNVTFGDPRNFVTADPGRPIADCQQGALMLEASGIFSHTLPANGPCGSVAGSDALATSNLSRFLIGPQAIDRLIEDAGLPTVDHRRWMMHEALQQMALGATNEFMVLEVTGPHAPGQRSRFSAWPPAGYVPFQWAYDRWSFSVPAVNQNPANPNTWADFSNAVVTVTQAGNPISSTSVAVSPCCFDGTIVWTFNQPIGRAPGMADTTYTVTISNVLRTAQSSYSYDVTIFDPTGAVAQANDECAGAIEVFEGDNGPFDNLSASNSSPAFGCGIDGQNDAWFRYDAVCNGQVTFATCNGTNFDTAIEVFSGTCGALSSIGCNDDSCGLASSVTVTTTVGQSYWVRVAGYAGARGTFGLSVQRAATSGGSKTTVPTGCGGASLLALGSPDMGGAVDLLMTGVAGTPGISLGFSPRRTPVCPPLPCQLGHDWAFSVAGGDLLISFPCNPSLVGFHVYAQGVDLFAPGGCSWVQITLTDTVDMTIG